MREGWAAACVGVGGGRSGGGEVVGVMVVGGPGMVCVVNRGRVARARWGWASTEGGSGLRGALAGECELKRGLAGLKPAGAN